MKIWYGLEQGTPEWLDARRGKFTASIASKLLTATGKVSTQFKSELGKIIAETMGLQDPEDNFVETFWMARGTELEAEARAWFTVETNMDIEEVGFIESDDRLLGVSPDGIMWAERPEREVGSGGVKQLIPLELKVPKPSTHIKWLIDGGLPKEHIQQCHFAMALTGAPYMYFMSYNPDLTPLIVKVESDDYTAAMVAAIEVYIAEFRFAFNLIAGETS
jgi:hypothetical protein